MLEKNSYSSSSVVPQLLNKRTKVNFANLEEWGGNEKREIFSQGFCHKLALHSKQI